MNGVRKFKFPTVEDILKHRVVVVTLNISMFLSTLGLKKGMLKTSNFETNFEYNFVIRFNPYVPL